MDDVAAAVAADADGIIGGGSGGATKEFIGAGF